MGEDDLWLEASVERRAAADALYAKNLAPTSTILIFRVEFCYRPLGRPASPEKLLSEERDHRLQAGEQVELDSAERLRRVFWEVVPPKARRELTTALCDIVYEVLFEPEDRVKPPGKRCKWLQLALEPADFLESGVDEEPRIQISGTEEGWS